VTTGLTALGAWSKFRGMAKPARKKSTAKKSAKKPAAKKPAKTPATAKRAAKAPAAPPRDQAGATAYTPKPIEGIGWQPFRYPLA
jgi:hypothetical protein